jgi:hypothetical protein
MTPVLWKTELEFITGMRKTDSHSFWLIFDKALDDN